MGECDQLKGLLQSLSLCFSLLAGEGGIFLFADLDLGVLLGPNSSLFLTDSVFVIVI